jgi:hypothetical protein
MARSSAPKRPSRVPGAKILLTASALAATLGGWASLTWKASANASAASPSLRSAEAQFAAVGINLQPLPTLVPGPSQLPVGVSPIPSQAGPQPVLRRVSAPPAPIVRTQSSRP